MYVLNLLSKLHESTPSLNMPFWNGAEDVYHLRYMEARFQR